MSTAPVVLAHSPPFRLGASEVRPATREILGPGGAEIVEPRVMQVLVALARAEGGILSRDDLIQSCWEGRIVGENAIDRTISRIRRLGETVGQGSFGVETITKVGYRLVQQDGTRLASPAGSTASPPRAQGGLDRRTAIGAGLAAAVGGGALWLGLRGTGPDVPPEAMRAYERGVQSLRRGWVEDAAEAVSAFQEAVAIAPDFADAWGMLAIAYEFSHQFAPPDPTATYRQRARSAARRALEIDPGNANALAARAFELPVYRNWATAETAHRRVLVRDAAQPETRHSLSRLLADVGRTRDALEVLAPLAATASMPFVQYWRAWLLMSADRLEESDRVIDRALAAWPRHFAVWFTRFWMYAYTGRAAQALVMVGDAANRPLGIPDRDFEIVAISARAMTTRSPADSDAAVRANMDAAPSGVGFCVNAIKVGAFLGRFEAAFAAAEALYFNRGFTVGPTFFTRQQGGYVPPEQRPTELLFSPPCRPMHADPRFRDLLREIGLADYWRRTGTRADVIAPA